LGGWDKCDLKVLEEPGERGTVAAQSHITPKLLIPGIYLILEEMNKNESRKVE
jgi:hypothetical protein